MIKKNIFIVGALLFSAQFLMLSLEAQAGKYSRYLTHALSKSDIAMWENLTKAQKNDITLLLRYMTELNADKKAHAKGKKQEAQSQTAGNPSYDYIPSRLRARIKKRIRFYTRKNARKTRFIPTRYKRKRKH